MIHSILILIIVILAGFVCYFLTLIAKFYRLKSGRGIHHLYYYLCTALVLIGILLSVEASPRLIMNYFSPVLVALGGTGLIVLSISLYKSMMSVNKKMG
jgi:hypothetical protein